MGTNQRIHDVIIVGAGPIGSHTAYLLARQGLEVVICEKNAAVGNDVNCTGIISAECMKRFNLLSGTIDKPVHTIKAFAPSGNSVQYRAEKPFAYTVNRGNFDKELNSLAQQEGVKTYLKTNVREVYSGKDCFQIFVKCPDGTGKVFRSNVGVIATGFELNALNGIQPRHVDFSYGIQADVLMDDLTDVEVYFGKHIAPGSFAWVVPTNGKSAKVGLIVKNNPVEYLKRFLGSGQISQRLISKDYKMKCSPLPMKRIQRSYGERLVIVGEAAGQVKTTTGGGIYFGLLCSEIAVQIISKAFACKDFSERMFRNYETEWRKAIDPELKAGKRLRNFFERLNDSQINFLINLAKTDGILPAIRRSDFDWHRDIISYLMDRLINRKIFQNTD
jgi:geranylgeranyl reductase family protein